MHNYVHIDEAGLHIHKYDYYPGGEWSDHPSGYEHGDMDDSGSWFPGEYDMEESTTGIHLANWVQIGYRYDTIPEHGIQNPDPLNDVKAGEFSVGIGWGCTAEGYYGIAQGLDANADEWLSIALGYHVKATGDGSFAHGKGSPALPAYGGYGQYLTAEV